MFGPQALVSYICLLSTSLWIDVDSKQMYETSACGLVVYNLHLITMILCYHRNVRMDRKLMFYDAVLTSIFISFVYSTLNG